LSLYQSLTTFRVQVNDGNAKLLQLAKVLLKKQV
jgi:hypothetical protein